ncbi:antigen 5 like allergen Cul n 1-like [Culex pipiens pallens]|uniref:antigen 5 like allergen Cul n 1-like n=1 Tax=Culex pipiens pallens TaxID=42434 RepID=UPI0019536387|nr:antigen 5 like allergen Cul n 1-like [Culex pipiens pallens]
MRNSMKRVLLHEHNRLRAQVASGDLRGYSPASRMPTLTWDGQLQFVAGCNARLCRFEHDKCRSTVQFRWAGQNLAMKSLFGRWRSVRVNQMLQEFVRGWFAEHKDANQAIIDRFPAKYKGPDIGHFTQLVSDRTWKMGCVMVRFSDRAIHYYLVCNYSFINIVDQPIYVKGKPCSRCQLKCNRKYPALCRVGEKIASKP